jgi:hypothetical protein
MAGISFAGAYYALASVLLLAPAYWFVKKAMARWDTVDQAGF